MPLFTSLPVSPSLPASKIKKKPQWIRFLYSVALFFSHAFVCSDYFHTSSNLQKPKTAGRENPDAARCLFAGSICCLLAGRWYLSAPCPSPRPVCEALCLLRSSKVFLFHVFFFFFLFSLAAERKPQTHNGFCWSF